MNGADRLAHYVTNPLPPITQQLVTGIIGDAPSRYAKTPPLWNAVYREFGWDAVSLPWDLTPDRLPEFMAAARGVPELAGFSVTNPFKIAILPLLDDLDPLARSIGAVNTVTRDARGRLIGFNTDGQGGVDALTRHLPGMEHPLLETLAGHHVVLVGAGGATRAIAFYLAMALAPAGRLSVVSRNRAKGQALAEGVRAASGVGEGGDYTDLRRWLPSADVAINATVLGQSGWRRLADGSAYLTEPYSALASAHPAAVPAERTLDEAASREWFEASRADIARNAADGLEAVASLKPGAVCFDLVYSPLETCFLRVGRWAGHRTQNGKWMNIAQAADAFARKVCASALARNGMSENEGYRRAVEVMARIW